MAIGYWPTDEDTDARYERMNAMLLEMFHMIVFLYSRDVERSEREEMPRPERRVRPHSDSSTPRLPDLVMPGHARPVPRKRISSQCSAPGSPSCSIQHFTRTFEDHFSLENSRLTQTEDSLPLDDEVFIPSPRIQPALTKKSPNLSKNTDNNDESRDHKIFKQSSVQDSSDEQDTVDSSSFSSEEQISSESAALPSLLSRSLMGSMWTAVLLTVVWKILR